MPRSRSPARKRFRAEEEEDEEEVRENDFAALTVPQLRSAIRDRDPHIRGLYGATKRELQGILGGLLHIIPPEEEEEEEEEEEIQESGTHRSAARSKKKPQRKSRSRSPSRSPRASKKGKKSSSPGKKSARKQHHHAKKRVRENGLWKFYRHNRAQLFAVAGLLLAVAALDLQRPDAKDRVLLKGPLLWFGKSGTHGANSNAELVRARLPFCDTGMDEVLPPAAEVSADGNGGESGGTRGASVGGGGGDGADGSEKVQPQPCRRCPEHGLCADGVLANCTPPYKRYVEGHAAARWIHRVPFLGGAVARGLGSLGFSLHVESDCLLDPKAKEEYALAFDVGEQLVREALGRQLCFGGPEEDGWLSHEELRDALEHLASAGKFRAVASVAAVVDLTWRLMRGDPVAWDSEFAPSPSRRADFPEVQLDTRKRHGMAVAVEVVRLRERSAAEMSLACRLRVSLVEMWQYIALGAAAVLFSAYKVRQIRVRRQRADKAAAIFAHVCEALQEAGGDVVPVAQVRAEVQELPRSFWYFARAEADTVWKLVEDRVLDDPRIDDGMATVNGVPNTKTWQWSARIGLGAAKTGGSLRDSCVVM